MNWRMCWVAVERKDYDTFIGNYVPDKQVGNYIMKLERLGYKVESVHWNNSK
jgi:hypothetical protein